MIWRLVIVESPFAPQTPSSTLTCTYETTCDKWAIHDGMVGCGNCLEHARVERLRQRERHTNQRYLAAALADCIRRGESPYASHAILTLPGVLDDAKPEERARGIEAGFAWRKMAALSAFYIDLGWSSGMRDGLAHAKELHGMQFAKYIEERILGPDWDK